ncbi:VTC domain-containing protein [Phialemonium atrogriseum]|uniref:VTC domain-containing protein n=1 Tax=Phialemonium atrogriseum TaxID=1093897 RepID=A0AAJ0C9A4_9PEZI|nr:VTC domain-containing protein [Phialemonium atrogriseum]KAK1772535.1 VTC domain-containing protein [Phialemonium atrogriseum]
MRFGQTLVESVYPPWKDKYIDYGKLKGMLREGKFQDDDVPWTEDDENRFCDEVFNTQLEKVCRFQEETVGRLRERADAVFEALKNLTPAGDKTEADVPPADQLKALEAELDDITNTVKELKKYSNINYTGFLKIVKKHDRKRGERYKIRPMMQVNLSKRPFNSEQGYSPLLNRLSLMYFAVRQQLEEDGAGDGHIAELYPDSATATHNGEKYMAYKFWVHLDNLIEVKTLILRRLPALVYSQQSSKELDGSEDPALTSIYFDNSKFDLYSKKVDRQAHAAASSLRLRWYGPLSQKPEIFLEQKILNENGSSEERKITIKEKYVKPFLDGEYKMEKTIQKMERQGQSAEEVESFRATAEALQEFVREHELEPVLRANYARSAFQKPGDDRVRIAIDTDVAFIREDTLDRSRPCRDPKDWHRSDIDSSNMAYPFKNINQSEVSRFPYATLEIKLKEGPNRKRPSWVADLMASHLVHPAPRFSKFLHGVASLFEDYVNILPFWLSDLETDIRKDPQVAFEEEEQRRAQRAENEQVVGSFLGNKVSSFVPTTSSPVAKSYLSERLMSERRATEPQGAAAATPASAIGRSGQPTSSAAAEGRGGEHAGDERPNYGTVSSVIPGGFSLTKYARAKRSRETALPEGVVEPTEWIKNSGPLQIEPKVWLANERTFLKWQHICILLGGLAISLYTAGGRDTLAEAMGIGYILIAVFAGAWAMHMHQARRSMIVQRSGKHFDNVVGPIVIAVALMLALVLNFIFAYRAAFARLGAGDDDWSGNSSFVVEELRFRV